MAAVKLNSGVFVEIEAVEEMGCVTIVTPLLDEEISPNEAREIAAALIAAADELDA